ncbi:MAG: glycosyltransferase [Myxacorys californica WJT36-NPBG1]|jgi:UDP:flavonoid glycosyltransferase YjiC (YdhE family)|nr:glycosyltransferase [Myxacorys californica WJT36-NPBG1]
MSRIVLATIGSLGDLHPMIALGLGLQERGHEVVVATHAEYRPTIEALGFEFGAMRPHNAAESEPALMAQLMDTRTGTESVVKGLMSVVRETYADLLAAAQNADFIIAGEVVYPARSVAETLGIPWAIAELSPISFLSAYDLPVFPGLPGLTVLRSLPPVVTRRVIDSANLATWNWSKPLQQLRQELGLPPVGNPITTSKFSPYLVLALFSAVFAAPQPDWPASTVQPGFVFYDGNSELTPELKEFLDAGEPPIVFTLGSAAVFDPRNFYGESIEAAKRLNRRAVLLIGKNPRPSGLTSDIVAFDYAPYSAIFSRACVVVHQGGIGTTAQALRAGCPTVVMPYSHDQPDNAARLERLGTSRTIPRIRYRAERVVNVLRDVLGNSRYAKNAAAIQQVISSEDGVGGACDAIAQTLNAHRHNTIEKR